EPQQVTGQGRLHIFRVDYIYNQANYAAGLRSGSAMDFGFGASNNCHTNVGCNLDANTQLLKRGICRILLIVEEGTGFCTGGLINNVREDNTPYVLSAFHCQDGFTPLHDFWRFDFNYEATNCTNPGEEPSFESILGCTQRAGRQENDFLLLELNNGIPNTFDAYFLGWDRRTVVPQDALMIHHPRGDIKKIAQTSRPIFIFGGEINWNNNVTTPAQHHFEVDLTDGTFEVNSSGAPLLNQDNRIVGQLHGGNAICDNAQSWYGRFSLSWEGGGASASRLKNWLDPDDSGSQTIDGRESQNTTGITLSGIVLTDGGDPIPNTQVQILGVNNGISLATTTDAQGNYSFSNITTGETYQISASKTDQAGNGLSVLDLIQMRKHVLNIDLFQSPYQMLAADVNQSNSISTLDLIQTQKVILGINVNFDNVATWTFLAANTTFNDPGNPFLGIASGGFTVSIPEEASNINDFDIIGIKAGDVNNTANLD
ncbi:MAG: carboxypeptidase regulatory-like domain-containing protein, partial [Bacteroidota bacterium]